MPKIDVICLPVGDFQENCYLVVNTGTRECLIVDPGAEGERIIQAAQAYRPAAVLLTHAHWDHIGAGSVCYLLPDGQGVLTGDTLFAHGYGRTDFADGSFHELKESLRALFHLSPRQVAYPGHEEAGTVGRGPAEG